MSTVFIPTCPQCKKNSRRISFLHYDAATCIYLCECGNRSVNIAPEFPFHLDISVPEHPTSITVTSEMTRELKQKEIESLKQQLKLLEGDTKQ